MSVIVSIISPTHLVTIVAELVTCQHVITFDQVHVCLTVTYTAQHMDFPGINHMIDGMVSHPFTQQRSQSDGLTIHVHV